MTMIFGGLGEFALTTNQNGMGFYALSIWAAIIINGTRNLMNMKTNNQKENEMMVSNGLYTNTLIVREDCKYWIVTVHDGDMSEIFNHFPTRIEQETFLEEANLI